MTFQVTHNKSFSREYEIWRAMKKRCYLKTHMAYKKYGGAGIEVCPEWKDSFENFYRDMGDCTTDKHTLDRIDNTKGYSKANCRWATMKEQQRNRGNTLYVKVNDNIVRLTEYAEQNNMTYSAAYMRLYRNKLNGVSRI